MGFFEKFRPNLKNKDAEKPTFVESPKEMDEVIDDQKDFSIPPELSSENVTSEVEKKILTRNILEKENTFVEKSDESEQFAAERQAGLDNLYDKAKMTEIEIENLEKNINDSEERLKIFAEESGRQMSTGGVTMRRSVAEGTATITEERLMNYIKKNRKELIAKKSELQEIKDQIKEKETMYDGGERHFGGYMN